MKEPPSVTAPVTITCPSCAAKDAEIAQLRKSREGLASELLALDTGEPRRIRQVYDELREEIARLREQLKAAESRVKTLDARIERLLGWHHQENPMDYLMERANDEYDRAERLREQLAAAEKTIEALREMVSKRTYLDICPWCHGRTLDFRQGDQGFGHEDFDLPPRHDATAKPCPANAEMHQARAALDRLREWATKRGHAGRIEKLCHWIDYDHETFMDIDHEREANCPGCTCGLDAALGNEAGG